MKTRKILVAVTGLATAGALVGLGVGASFTDSGSATQHVAVGSFGITVNSTATGAIVVNSGVPGNSIHTVSYTAPVIQGSAAGTSPFPFTVTSTGSVPASITVSAAVSGNAKFSDMLGVQAPVTLNQNQTQPYAAGLKWTELGNGDLNATAHVIYSITAGEVPVGQQPLDAAYITTPRLGYNNVFVCDYVRVTPPTGPFTFNKVDRMGSTNVGPNPGFNVQWPQGNNYGAKAYVLAYDDGQALPPANTCPLASTIS